MSATAAPSRPPANLARVLVVDDDRAICRALDRILSHAGYSVSTATTGASAMEALRASRPEIVLLDLTLANEDGAMVFAQMRAELGAALPPVIVCSGAARTIEGAAGTIRKPFDPAALIATIVALLSSPSAAPA